VHILITHEVDVRDGEPFAQQAALEHATEEA
jgi:hypothetical protein